MRFTKGISGNPKGRPKNRKNELPYEVVLIPIARGSINAALRPLRMANKYNHKKDTAYMLIGPWLVQSALNRLNGHQLSIEEQQKVVDATRTPHKVS